MAGPVSHPGFQYMDIVETFNVSLDLSTSGCWASSVCGCYSVLECCNLFTGVELSIRSFCIIFFGEGALFWMFMVIKVVTNTH